MVKKAARKPSAAKRQQTAFEKAMSNLRSHPTDHDAQVTVMGFVGSLSSRNKSRSKEVDL